jgi:hypothetical protein
MPRVLIIHAEDGQVLADRVMDLIREKLPKGVRMDTTRELPDRAESLLVLFVLSPGSIRDQQALEFAEDAARREFPVVPIVEDITTYSFALIPANAQLLGSRNAIGLAPNEERFLETVRGHLGLESFVRHRQVFISYRRTDAEAVAQDIEQFLWTRRCVPFLDTIQLEGGVVVQDKVMQALHEKDFVVYIDSSDASASPWVLAELTEALAQRIPVCMVRIDPGRVHLDLLRDAPSMIWDPSNPRNLDTLMGLISRGIAGRVTLDERVVRTIRGLGEAHDLRVKFIEGEKRRAEMTGRGKTIRIEWEDSAISLERLYRLYELYTEAPPSDTAIFICGDRDLFPPTRKALVWACGRHPLRILSTATFGLELARIFPPDLAANA